MDSEWQLERFRRMLDPEHWQRWCGDDYQIIEGEVYAWLSDDGRVEAPPPTSPVETRPPARQRPSFKPCGHKALGKGRHESHDMVPAAVDRWERKVKGSWLT
jgi:hypothetical protein